MAILNQKQGRPAIPNGLALRLFQHVVSFLYRSPPAGLIFPLNHRLFRIRDEFIFIIFSCDKLCKWNPALPNAFSNAVASLQQYLPAFIVRPKNGLCQKHG